MLEHPPIVWMLTLHATQMNQLAYFLIIHSSDRRGAAQIIQAPGFQC